MLGPAFPLPLRIGTDICSFSRIRGIMSRPIGKRFVRRILTPEERSRSSVVDRYLGLETGNEGRCGDERVIGPASWLMAGRFAAKEAVIKAYGGGVTFQDITIRKEKVDERGEGVGRPLCFVKTQDGAAQEQALISVSHDGDYATAMCLAYRMDITNDGGRGGKEGPR